MSFQWLAMAGQRAQELGKRLKKHRCDLAWRPGLELGGNGAGSFEQQGRRPEAWGSSQVLGYIDQRARAMAIGAWAMRLGELWLQLFLVYGARFSLGWRQGRRVVAPDQADFWGRGRGVGRRKWGALDFGWRDRQRYEKPLVFTL